MKRFINHFISSLVVVRGECMRTKLNVGIHLLLPFQITLQGGKERKEKLNWLINRKERKMRKKKRKAKT